MVSLTAWLCSRPTKSEVPPKAIRDVFALNRLPKKGESKEPSRAATEHEPRTVQQLDWYQSSLPQRSALTQRWFLGRLNHSTKTYPFRRS